MSPKTSDQSHHACPMNNANDRHHHTAAKATSGPHRPRGKENSRRYIAPGIPSQRSTLPGAHKPSVMQVPAGASDLPSEPRILTKETISQTRAGYPRP
jgi:hypothetical protein